MFSILVVVLSLHIKCFELLSEFLIVSISKQEQHMDNFLSQCHCQEVCVKSVRLAPFLKHQGF